MFPQELINDYQDIVVKKNQGSNDKIRESLVFFSRKLGKSASYASMGDGLELISGHIRISDIPKALKRFDISSKIVSKDLSLIKSYQLPSLLLLDEGNVLILTSLSDSIAVVIDPESGGELTLDIDTLQKLCKFVVLAKPMYTKDSRASDIVKESNEHWFKKKLKAQYWVYIEVAIASFFANCLAIATSLFALQVYDRVVPNNAFNTLLVLTSGVVLAIFFDFLLRISRTIILESTGKKLDKEVSSILFNQVLQMRLNFKPKSTGAFSNQIKEFDSVREFFTSSTAATISDIPFIFIFLLIIFYIGGGIVIVPIFAMIFMVFPALLMQGKLASLSRENLKESAVKNGLILESIENLENLKASNAENRNLILWNNLTEKLASDNLALKKLSATLQYGSAMAQQLCYVFIVVYGVYAISNGELTIGGLIACTMLAARTVAPVNQIAGILTRWQHVKVAMEGLDDFMEIPTERPSNRDFVKKEILKGNYRIENLKLKYDEGSSDVLNITNLNIEAGSQVVILGSNGSGKSSLLRILAGISDYNEGNLLLDDVRLNQIEPVDRKRRIGYLPQDTALFYGSLRDNLILDGSSEADTYLLEILDKVGLGESVRKHPLGLDLPITGNLSMSGGQRRSIGIARVILQDPQIVILDEPTSSLDQKTEDSLLSFLKGWIKGRTLIMSTHKRKVTSLAERGIVLEEGKIIMDNSLNTKSKEVVT